MGERTVEMAIEVGGTFTDLIWTDAAGAVRTHKVPSTPDDPARGVLAGLEEALEGDLAALGTLFHGSTVATNAVIERRGCRAALLTTRGFRDLLAIQRQLRPNVYSLACVKPQPLIPAERILEVSERIAADGSVVEPLDEAAAMAALDELVVRERPQALAICLLHAYRNPVHEERLAALVRARHPDLPVVLSSAVLPTFREYERASTTAMAAYLAPLVGRYLALIESRLESVGGRLFVMQSSGGILPAAGIGERGVEMLNSGPAAGVIAASRAAELLGDTDLLTLDIGGTSADVCLIADGRPAVRAETEIDGLPVGMPTVDIANVGAGGGSVAWLDRGGMLQVGPRSAGAQPGPACYGRGGSEPTVTDALVRLGWIRPEAFLGGRMTLDADAAGQALAGVAGSLGETPDQLAEAIVAIATANVARGVRLVSVQRGHDPKRHALYAYGGMGPMIAALVAEDLEIRRIVVPPNPGLFSAVGLMVAEPKRIYRETALLALADAAGPAVRAGFERLQSTAAAEFADYGVGAGQLVFDWILEMRYLGQGFELLVPVEPARLQADGAGYLREAFRAAHEAAYGEAPPREEVEVVTFRLVASKPRAGSLLDRFSAAPSGAPEEAAGRVRVRGAELDCRFLRRSSLPEGYAIAGCAILEEPTATTFVPPGWSARVGRLGAIEMTHDETGESRR